MNSKEIKEFRKEWSNPNRFTTTYTMKEAINKQECIISILDVLQESPIFLNKCTSDLFAVIYNLSPESRESLLNTMTEEQVVNLFMQIRVEYDAWKYPVKTNIFKSYGI